MKRFILLLVLVVPILPPPGAGAAPVRPATERVERTDATAGGPRYLVRSREPLPRIPGVVEVVRDASRTVVAGEPEALESLRSLGHTLYPLPYGTTPPRAPLRTWSWIASADPEVQDLVDQVSWPEISAKVVKLQRFGTRFALTPKALVVADTLAAFFQRLGLPVEFQDVAHTFQVQRNVVATQVGTTYPDRIFIICGHYDSLSDNPWSSAPGADDNASGTTAVMTAAEILSTRWFRYTIKYIAFAGEELGMYGSDGYADWAAAQGLDIVGALNFDMIGYWIPGVDFDLEIESNEASVWLMNAVTNAADLYTAMPYETHVDNSATWGDHASFWFAGYPAVNHEEAWGYTDPDFNANYHTTLDRADLLWPDFTTGSVKVAVAAVATLAELDQSITGVPARPVGTPLRLGAFPNPFRSQVTLDLALPDGPARARVGVFDARGRLLEVLSVPLHDGRGTLVWNPDRHVPGLPAAVYFARPLDGGASGAVKLIHLE